MATPQPNRSLIGRIAAYERWARETDRTAATSKARAGLRARFEREADPDGTLPAAERAARAEALMRAHMLRMSLASKRSAAPRRGGPLERASYGARAVLNTSPKAKSTGPQQPSSSTPTLRVSRQLANGTSRTIPKGKAIVSPPLGRRKLWLAAVWNCPFCQHLHIHRSGPKALFDGEAVRACVVNGGRYVLHPMGGAA